MGECCDRILAVYPEEAAHFKAAGIPVDYVGGGRGGAGGRGRVEGLNLAVYGLWLSFAGQAPSFDAGMGCQSGDRCLPSPSSASSASSTSPLPSPPTPAGHPLVDRAAAAPTRAAARASLGVPPSALVVTLLPASRSQEMRHVWPVVADAARRLAEGLVARGRDPPVFLLPAASAALEPCLLAAVAEAGLSRASVVSGSDTLAALAAADLAITKSGSVNVELALLGVPQVALYRLDAPTAFLARRILGFKVQRASPAIVTVDPKASCCSPSSASPAPHIPPLYPPPSLSRIQVQIHLAG